MSKEIRTTLDLNVEQLAKGINAAELFDDDTLFSDIDISKAFAESFEKCLRYNTTAKKWFYFDGFVWNEDNTKTAERAVEKFTKALYLWAEREDAKTKKRIVDLQSLNNRKKILEGAQAHLAITSQDFDAKPHLLNCKCGTFNLNTLQWDGDRQYWGDFLTKCANVDKRLDTYTPDDYKDISRFVSQLLPPDRAALVQQIAGLCLTEDVREECFYIFFGSTTRNGKSALVDSISNMLGNYAVTVNPETFSTNTRSGNAPSPDRAKMKAARLISVSEFPKNTTMDTAFVKRLTGGDTITARHLHQEEIEFYVVGKIILNTNYTPHVNDLTVFDSDRAVVVNFENQFKGDKQDITLKDRLKTSKYANQFFYWALDGLKAYRKAGRLLLPQSVRQAVEEYRKKSDQIAQFLDDCTEPDPDGKIKGSYLYTIYESWSGAGNLQHVSKLDFFEELRRKGLLRKTVTMNGETVRNVLVGRKPKPQFEKLLL